MQCNIFIYLKIGNRKRSLGILHAMKIVMWQNIIQLQFNIQYTDEYEIIGIQKNSYFYLRIEITPEV